MFTLLKNYCDEDFFKSHPVFYLLTPDANYKCHVLHLRKRQKIVYSIQRHLVIIDKRR